MNPLANPSGMPLTMTSREISELTGKDHKHVMRDLRSLQEQLGVLFVGSVQNWTHPQNGQTYEEFVLDKETTLTLLLGYDAVARMKVVKRWQELEADTRDPVKALNDPSTLRQVLLGYTEKVLALEHQVEELAPKAEALDRIATADGSLCLTDAAKTLQVQPRKFMQLLQEKGWVYRRPMGTGWLAYQDRIQAGQLEHKVTKGEKSDGSEWASTQVRVTPRGLTKLAQDLGAH